MKTRAFLFAALLACALTACSGGGSTGGTPPTAPPTIAPVSYTAKIVFAGALAGHQQIQGWLRRAALDAGASPPPIMVLTSYTDGPVASNFGGTVYAIVSPFPSASPTVTFSQTNSAAVIFTPAPLPSGQTPAPLPSGAIAAVSVYGVSGSTGQNAGTATATVGSPVGQSPTTPVYSYSSIAVDCSFTPGIMQYGGAGSGEYVPHYGWKWNGTSWSPDDNDTTADVYIDGPMCNDVNSTEAVATFHIPGGDTRLPVATSFASVTPSEWANSETSFTIQDVFLNGFVIGKTRDGNATFKWFGNAIQSDEAGMFGGIEVSGVSVDGF